MNVSMYEQEEEEKEAGEKVNRIWVAVKWCG